MIPVFSILIKSLGEIYATLGMAVGVGGCIFIWLSKLNPLDLMGEIERVFPSLFPEQTFFGGVLFLVYFGIISFAVFIGSYFLAESMEIMVGIAKGIRLLLEEPGHSRR